MRRFALAPTRPARPVSYDGAVSTGRRSELSTAHRATARCAVLSLPSFGWGVRPAEPSLLGCFGHVSSAR